MKKFVEQNILPVHLNASQFQYYFDYINTIANTNYTNLAEYKPFINDTRINPEDFVNIATELKNRSGNPLKAQLRLVLTELGVCFTSSRLNNVLDPYKGYFLFIYTNIYLYHTFSSPLKII